MSFAVKNTGTVAGATVAHVYVGATSSTVDRPDKELKGFERVLLQPGESRTVTIGLTPRDLAFFNVKTNDWDVEAGSYSIRVGDSSATLPLTGQVSISAPLHIPLSD